MLLTDDIPGTVIYQVMKYSRLFYFANANPLRCKPNRNAAVNKKPNSLLKIILHIF